MTSALARLLITWQKITPKAKENAYDRWMASRDLLLELELILKGYSLSLMRY
jgi:hypothetical protein